MAAYCIQAKLKLEVGVDVSAKSLEEAIEKARKLKVTDFVTIGGEYLDGDLNIIGLWENS